MKQYKDLVKKLLKSNMTAPAARDNMPDTKILNSYSMTFNFDEGFPILTGKQMPFYSILGELIAFMKGETDVRAFDRLGCKVWWDNAYKWNIVDNDINLTMEEYKSGRDLGGTGIKIKNSLYDLGRIYSAQWRSYKGADSEGLTEYKDQLLSLINNINNKPYSRYHVMTAWNPVEMNSNYVSQSNCHVYYQNNIFDIGRLNYLHGHITQRSADTFLGVPFNITSYALLTILIGKFTNTRPYSLTWTGVNTHLYSNHFEQAKEYVKRVVYKLPSLNIIGINNLNDIMRLETLDDLKEHFILVNYKHGDKIKAPLSVGL